MAIDMSQQMESDTETEVASEVQVENITVTDDKPLKEGAPKVAFNKKKRGWEQGIYPLEHFE